MFSQLGFTCRALEDLDVTAILELLNPSAQGDLLDADHCRRPREAFCVGRGYCLAKLADFDRQD